MFQLRYLITRTEASGYLVQYYVEHDSDYAAAVDALTEVTSSQIDELTITEEPGYSVLQLHPKVVHSDYYYWYHTGEPGECVKIAYRVPGNGTELDTVLWILAMEADMRRVDGERRGTTYRLLGHDRSTIMRNRCSGLCNGWHR